MNTTNHVLCTDAAPLRLSDEQRVLLEQVSSSPSAFENIRRRARALLLLDEGLPPGEVTRRAAMDHRTLRSLVSRHRIGGVRSALLGMRPSLKRLHWLALSPMNH